MIFWWHPVDRCSCFQVSFNRSSMVRVEAHVSINCSITSETNYVWRLFNAMTHKPLSLQHFNLTQHVFHDPVFIIPPRSLPYGRYLVELLVCVDDFTAIWWRGIRTSWILGLENFRLKVKNSPLSVCFFDCWLGWVVQGLTSHRTHYRLFQRRVFCKGFPSLLQVKRPNQQHQYTEGIIKRIGK